MWISNHQPHSALPSCDGCIVPVDQYLERSRKQSCYFKILWIIQAKFQRFISEPPVRELGTSGLILVLVQSNTASKPNTDRKSKALLCFRKLPTASIKDLSRVSLLLESSDSKVRFNLVGKECILHNVFKTYSPGLPADFANEIFRHGGVICARV